MGAKAAQTPRIGGGQGFGGPQTGKAPAGVPVGGQTADPSRQLVSQPTAEPTDIRSRVIKSFMDQFAPMLRGSGGLQQPQMRRENPGSRFEQAMFGGFGQLPTGQEQPQQGGPAVDFREALMAALMRGGNGYGR